jgi:ATP/maltotriose-dependent transcriptional regulator MalT
LAGQAVGLARDNDLETLALQGIFAGANVHTVKNQNVEAVAELERALEIATRYRDEENQARAQLSLAVVYQRMMLPGKAEVAIAAALPYYERKWPGRNLLSASYVQAQLEFGRAKYLAAAARFQRVQSEAVRIGDANLQQLAVGSLAMTLQETGELAESLRLYGAAAEGARKTGKKRAAAFALLSEAEAASAMGQFGRADERLVEAGKLIDGLDAEGRVAPLARKVLSTAVVLLRKGQGEAALRVLAGARGVDGAPGAAADLAYYRCSAYALTGQVREGLAACGELRAAAERSGAARYGLKADLLEAVLYERAGEKGKVAERLGRVLANTDARFDALAARLIAASGGGEDGVSPELEKLRLQLGEPVVSAWMSRPDNKRQFANWREKGRGK